jgi:hypothetical protein
MDIRGRTLCLITPLVCVVNGTASWSQTYNPTASDPVSNNTAGGTGAVPANKGKNNTAFGRNTLPVTSGSANAAFGVGALQANTTGLDNVAVGMSAGKANTVGGNNTFLGFDAGKANMGGGFNAVVGAHALHANTNAGFNTAVGAWALSSNSSGEGNIAVGYRAGIGNIDGNENIYLGHTGAPHESHTMRLGTIYTNTVYMEGVAAQGQAGVPVVITPLGKLGILTSSARYKTDIQSMRARSTDIYKLRPVTFRYKTDQEHRRQYGLIAEEVAKVYPELVVKAADGKVESVQYHELISMLLNEVQRQQQKLDVQAQQLTTQGQQLAELQAQNARLEAAVVQQHAAFAARLEHLEQGARLTTVSTR